MKRLFLPFFLAASPALATDLPSGQTVELQEVLVDQLGKLETRCIQKGLLCSWPMAFFD